MWNVPQFAVVMIYLRAPGAATSTATVYGSHRYSIPDVPPIHSGIGLFLLPMATSTATIYNSHRYNIPGVS